MREQSVKIVRFNEATAADMVQISSDNLDAFSRVPVSDPMNLFATQMQYDAESLQMETGSTGTGATSWSSDTRMVSLSATAGSGTAFTQSYQYIPYQPGKSQKIKITGVIGAAVANVTKDFGYFDSANGIFLRQNGTNGLQIIRRTSTGGSVVNNTVEQADWSEDPLNGTGASGITLDVTKCMIIIADLQFLGMGEVRFGFNIDGAVYWAHHFKNANNLSVPYMQTATLPVQALLTAASSGSTATMYFKCAAVESEGGFSTDRGYPFTTRQATATAGNGTAVHILSIRPLTTFNSLTNRALFILDNINVNVTGNNSVFWQLCIGSTFSVEPTYANVNSTYSAFEYGTAGTLSGAGIAISSGFLAATATSRSSESANVSLKYPISLNRAGAVRANGTLSLLVTGIGGTSACQASFNFTEIR